MIQPVLHTDRLHLQPLTPHHVDAVHSIWGDAEVIWWGHHRDPDETARFVEQVLEREGPAGAGWWIAFDRSDGKVVGDVVLQRVPRTPPEIEIGWHLARSQWGKGYATEAARHLLRHAFEVLGLESIIADIATHNERSMAVARRLGMTRRPELVERAGIPHGVWELRSERAPGR